MQRQLLALPKLLHGRLDILPISLVYRSHCLLSFPAILQNILLVLTLFTLNQSCFLSSTEYKDEWKDENSCRIKDCQRQHLSRYGTVCTRKKSSTKRVLGQHVPTFCNSAPPWPTWNVWSTFDKCCWTCFLSLSPSVSSFKLVCSKWRLCFVIKELSVNKIYGMQVTEAHGQTITILFDRLLCTRVLYTLPLTAYLSMEKISEKECGPLWIICLPMTNIFTSSRPMCMCVTETCMKLASVQIA